MSERVVLTNSGGNFSVDLSQEEARNVIDVQRAERRRPRVALASLMGLAAAAGFGFGGGRSRRSSYAGERCIECDAKMPPGKPRKCKACRENTAH